MSVLDIDRALRLALRFARPGTAAEFGVAKGRTLRMIAEKMPVVGFDSFEGLPEDWRPGFEKGRFACPVPEVPNAEIIVGWFADTLPLWKQPVDLSLVHIDCDLYSSTVTVLNHLDLHQGMVVVFDEWHGYPGYEDHEQKAWFEHVEKEGITWLEIARGPEQMALVVT